MRLVIFTNPPCYTYIYTILTIWQGYMWIESIRKSVIQFSKTLTNYTSMSFLNSKVHRSPTEHVPIIFGSLLVVSCFTATVTKG